MKHLIFQCVAMVVAVPFHGFISVYLAATFLFLTGLSLFSLFSLIMLAHEMTELRRFDDHVRLTTKGEGLERLEGGGSPSFDSTTIAKVHRVVFLEKKRNGR